MFLLQGEQKSRKNTRERFPSEEIIGVVLSDINKRFME